jgi:hypothetical protein
MPGAGAGGSAAGFGLPPPAYFLALAWDVAGAVGTVLHGRLKQPGRQAGAYLSELRQTGRRGACRGMAARSCPGGPAPPGA